MNHAVRLTIRSRYSLITMDYGAANAIDLRFIGEFNRCLDRLPQGPLLITGTGKFFSSGLNLKIIHEMNRESLKSLILQFQDLLLRITSFTQPSTAVINGHAVAGGFLLACACDEQVLRQGNYRLGMNEGSLKITLPPVPVALLKEKFGEDYERITGDSRFFTPEDMLAGKYFHQGVSACFSEIAARFNKKPPRNRREGVMKILRGNDGGELDRFLNSWFSAEAVKQRELFIRSDDQKFRETTK